MIVSIKITIKVLIPAIYRISGYYNFVPTELIYILNKDSIDEPIAAYLSVCLYECLYEHTYLNNYKCYRHQI